MVEQISDEDGIIIKFILNSFDNWPEFDENELEKIINKQFDVSLKDQEFKKEYLKNYIKKLSNDIKELKHYSLLKYIDTILRAVLGLLLFIAMRWLVISIIAENYISSFLISLIFIYIIYLSFFSRIKIGNYIIMIFDIKLNISYKIIIAFIPLFVLAWRAFMEYGSQMENIYIYIFILLAYTIFLLIPQIVISSNLSNYEFKTELARMLEEENPEYKTTMSIKGVLFRSYSLGVIDRELDLNRENDKKITIDDSDRLKTTQKNVNNIIKISEIWRYIQSKLTKTSSNFNLRRKYADALLPYLPLHSFFYLIFIFLLYPRIFISEAVFNPIINSIPIYIQYILIIGIAVVLYLVFIEYPFYSGQRIWKSKETARLELRKIEAEKYIDKLFKEGKITGDEFQGYIEARDVYKDEIEEKLNVPMHPHRLVISIWLFAWGIISAILAEIISKGIIPTQT
jgi:hypothetical protein